MQTRVCLILFASMMLRAERCDPPAGLHDFVQSLPDRGRERRDQIEQRLAGDPENFWLTRLWLDSSVYEKRAIREKYRKRFEAHPESLDDEYLYARSLVGFDTKEALRIYARILQKDADYPWVHYSQLEIFRASAFHDRDKLRGSFETITGECPSWTEPYRYLVAMNDDGIAPAAARLRGVIERSKDRSVLALYSTLWTAEFRTRAKSEEETRIAADVQRLRDLDGPHETIANGARWIGDTVLAREMTPPRKPDLFTT